MGLKKFDAEDYAKRMYLTDNLTQKEIAERAGVQEKTLIKWIKDGGWKALKRSRLNTKESQIERFYTQMEWLNNKIATRPIVYDIPPALLKGTKVKSPDGGETIEYPTYVPEDHPVLVGNVATSKEADILSKLSASISRLETETSVGEMYEVAKQVIDLARGEGLEFTRKVTALFDVLISTKKQTPK